MRIPFNKPYFTGNELKYIKESMDSGKISGDGKFTKKCTEYFEHKYGFKKALLTTSCTDALELSSLLIELRPGDEVIVPSYTFVSSVNPFMLRGAKIVFCDSEDSRPHIDPNKLRELINKKTKAIVIVHYAGIACDMEPIMEIAESNDLFLIEDAAHAVDSFYCGKPLGSLGHLSAFSFHETKNITCGEGGMIVINDDRFTNRAEILREKGTNRAAFFRGEINKYGWVDVGSSYLPADLLAAVLYAQAESLESIQEKRKKIWELYFNNLIDLEKCGKICLPHLPGYSTNNAHMFYFTCRNINERDGLIRMLKENEIQAVFHYQSLHSSQFFKSLHDGRKLSNAEKFADCLLRLPLYFELKESEAADITGIIRQYYKKL